MSTPKKNPSPTLPNMKALSPGTAASSHNPTSTSNTLVPSPSFSPDFADIRLDMRRAILRSSFSKSVGEAELENRIEKELMCAERIERKWLERIKDEGVSFAWVWVA